MSGVEHFVSDFQRRLSARESREPGWLATLRKAAIARFAEVGFPTPREEDWKYTNVSRVVDVPYRPAIGARGVDLVTAKALGGEDAIRLVFVNGQFARDASHAGRLPEGVRVESLAEALARGDRVVERHLSRHAAFDRNGFTALSTAFLEDGAFVFVPDRMDLERPIELVFVASGGEVVAYPRLLVVCGREAHASLVERHVSATTAGSTLTNTVGELVLGDGARLEHVRIVRQNARDAHVATTEVVVGRDGRYASSALALRSAFLRHNLNVHLAGEGAACSLDGLYLASGEEFVDNHTAIDHAVPHGTSREIYKGVLGGKAKAVFNGKVIVRPNAQKSDAQQTNKNLLLSETSEIDTKPELQIFADDVKCAHGAAIGQLDPDALFYLKSRGIGEGAARRLLIRGFASEVIERVPIADVRPELERAVVERLERDLAEER